MKDLLFSIQEGDNITRWRSITAEESEDMQGCDHRQNETGDKAEKSSELYCPTGCNCSSFGRSTIIKELVKKKRGWKENRQKRGKLQVVWCSGCQTGDADYTQLHHEKLLLSLLHSD